MPQPLSAVRKDATSNIFAAGGAPFLQYPDLAQLVMTAIFRHSQLEASMLHLFVDIMGGNKSVAAALYLSLEARNAKANAIEAASKTILKETQHAVLMAIIRRSKSCQKKRDALAHGLWGVSRDVPDALILLDAKSSVLLDSTELHNHVYVYRKKDLVDIAEETQEVIGMLMTFRLHISGEPDFAPIEVLYNLCRLLKLALPEGPT